MIELTRLNGHKFLVNCDLIKYVEAAPDTTLTLVAGEKLLVAEGCNEVAELILESRVRVFRMAWPDALPTLSMNPIFDASSELQKKDTAGFATNP